MKLLLIIITLFISSQAMAKDCQTTNKSDQVTETIVITTDVPNHLKGATITVTKANGESSVVPAELFKVVARKQERIVSKVLEKETITCRENSNPRNRVSLLGGYGPKSGLTKDVSSSRVEIESHTGLNAGVQYQRNIYEDISVGAQVQSNKAGALIIGLDF
jgi:hypothetical protein